MINSHDKDTKSPDEIAKDSDIEPKVTLPLDGDVSAYALKAKHTSGHTKRARSTPSKTSAKKRLAPSKSGKSRSAAKGTSKNSGRGKQSNRPEELRIRTYQV